MLPMKSFIVGGLGCVEVCGGLVVNAFITAINLRDGWTSGRLKPYDKIMVNLGLSRIFLLSCLSIRVINRMLQLNAISGPAQRCVLRTVQLLFDFASLWFAMWLCLLYFVKIAIFKNHFLLWVKVKVPQFIPPVVVLTYAVSFVFGFTFAVLAEGTSNASLPSSRDVYKELSYLLPAYFFGHGLPFIFVSASTLLVIRTIALHVRRVKANITGFTGPRLDAHFSAIRSAVLLEVMTVGNLLATVIFHFDFYGQFETSVSTLLLLSYPLLHSMVIVAGNAKLKGAFWRAVDCFGGKTAVEEGPVNQCVGGKRENIAQQK